MKQKCPTSGAVCDGLVSGLVGRFTPAAGDVCFVVSSGAWSRFVFDD